MSKLKVLMVNKYYPPHIGGVEFHVADLAEGLVAEGYAEVTVLVVNGGPQRVDEMRNGVRVVRVPRAFEYASTPVSWSLRREYARLAGEADVVHFHFPYPYGEFCSLLTRTSAPIVVTYHTDIVRQKKLLALYRPFLERFLDRADVLIASSPNMIEHSEFLSSRKEKCRQVNFGLPVERYAETPVLRARADSLAAPYGDSKIVLFVGRLVYYKGVGVLLDAFSRMGVTDAQLVIIGRGPLEDQLREQARALGIAGRVAFLPTQSSEDLAAWYAAADVFVLPSIERSEAFGLVQIEAHAAGTPVICTDLPTGVPYANLDGVTGLVVPVGDADALAGAMDRLLSDDELRERLGAQARERAFKEFTIPEMCRRTRSVYDEVVSKRSDREGE